MEFLLTIFNETIYKPILNLLVVVINFVPGGNLGVAIILVTLLTRFLLYPLSYKALKSQKELSNLQPKIKELQKKHKDNKQEQSQAVMKLYKEHGVNPFAGCVPFLIQLPLIIGLYRVFLADFANGISEGLYSFVSAPSNINTAFLGLNLTEASLVLAILAGFAQFALGKLTFSQKNKMGVSSGKKGDFQNIMGKQMTYVLPVVTIFIAQSFPAGLVLYWFTTTVFSFAQQYVINKRIKQPTTPAKT